MIDLSIICFCHTDYSQGWEPYFDYLEKPNIPYKKLIAVNNKKEAEDFFNKHPRFTYDRIIEYDETIGIPKRLSIILQDIKEEFVLYVSDNNFITSCDPEKIKSILEWLHDKNYDSMQFIGTKLEPDDFEVVKDDIIVKPCYTVYPFSFLPSIWRTSSMLLLMNIFKDSTYRSFEFDVQPFIRQYMKCFRPACLGEVKTNCDSKMELYFNFMHVLGSRKWVKDIYMQDYEEEFNTMIKKYNIDLSILGRH